MEIVKIAPPDHGEITTQFLATFAKLKHSGKDVEFHLHEDDDMLTGAYRTVVMLASEADQTLAGNVIDFKRVETNGDTTQTSVAC